MKQYNSEFAAEFYEIAGVVEAVVLLDGKNERIRIEAIEGPEGTFSTACYIRQALTQTAAGKRRAIQVWATYELEPTHRQAAGDAIDQALSFLANRSAGRSSTQL